MVVTLVIIYVHHVELDTTALVVYDHHVLQDHGQVHHLYHQVVNAYNVKQEKVLQVSHVITSLKLTIPLIIIILILLLELIDCQSSSCTIQIEIQQPSTLYNTNGNDPLFWDGNLNLNEVEIWASSGSNSSGSNKIPLSSLSVSLSSYYNGDTNVINSCFDGDLNSGCHSNLDVPYSLQHATLTVIVTGVFLNTIKVYNRLDCCQGRIRNAKISVSINSSQVWSDRFDDTVSMGVYTFKPFAGATSIAQCSKTLLFTYLKYNYYNSY